ncbi:MAG: hypothetical protein IJU86_03005 [Firmicutes bacterium]|nr:hypothetical protein [Bacillota bacterium]
MYLINIFYDSKIKFKKEKAAWKKAVFLLLELISNFTVNQNIYFFHVKKEIISKSETIKTNRMTGAKYIFGCLQKI